MKDDAEAFVRQHCPDLEVRQTSGRLRWMIALRSNDPSSPLIACDDLGQAWLRAFEAVRREQGEQ